MSSHAFLLILFSSLMHALYNLLVKQSRDKTVFIWWMFVCSAGLFTLLLPVLPGPATFPPLAAVLFAAGAATCFVLYHLFIGKAYQSGDLSVTYPLSQTSMMYVPLWSVWLLDEKLSLMGVGGICLIAAGAYSIQLQTFQPRELVRPFTTLLEHPVRAALAAGLLYSVGAIFDKVGVQTFSPLHFTYMLVLSMLALMTANLWRSRHGHQVLAEWRKNRLLILASGPLMMGSFLSFRYGLAQAPLSYAVPVRQVSVLLGVMFGVLFLGERFGRIRLLASLLILAGACLIRLA